jgi:hypothetical protein
MEGNAPTVIVDEFVAVPPNESVAVSVMLYIPAAENVKVLAVCTTPLLGVYDHEYLYEDSPPDVVFVNVTDCPTFIDKEEAKREREILALTLTTA